MFGSEILDVAIGLILVYLLLSLFASAVREAVESGLRARAVYLERGIRELLDDADGKQEVAEEFYKHPLIASLYLGTYAPNSARRLGRNLPAYLAPSAFATTVLDMLARGKPVPGASVSSAPADYSPEGLRTGANRFKSKRLQHLLHLAIDRSGGDLVTLQRYIEEWFTSCMDQLSGIYKRRTQYWLFAIGMTLTVTLNVNTITIANYLARNKAARESIVRRAEIIAKDSSLLRIAGDSAALQARFHDLAVLDLPIGARADEADTAPRGFLLRWTGLVLTALAITLGAPFWFNLLNRALAIRSTLKPPPRQSTADLSPPVQRTLTAADSTSRPAVTPASATQTTSGSVAGAT